MKTPLIEIKGLGVPVKGTLEIQVIISTPPKCVSLQQTFMVINMYLTYNIIIGRPFLHEINVFIALGTELPNSKRSGYNARESSKFKATCLYLFEG